jgi:hypothetical protein
MESGLALMMPTYSKIDDSDSSARLIHKHFQGKAGPKAGPGGSAGPWTAAGTDDAHLRQSLEAYLFYVLLSNTLYCDAPAFPGSTGLRPAVTCR